MHASDRIVGIDFSGSKTPGRKIWITEGTATAEDNLEIATIQSAADRFEVSGREAILDKLVAYIADFESSTIVGLDFPFGLPERSVTSGSWKEFVEEFHEEFAGKSMDDFPGTF